MKTLFLSAALLISFSACATTPAPAVPEPVPAAHSTAPAPAATPAVTTEVATASAVVEDAMICERVKELGSTRLKRVCKPTSQRLREREAAREAMEEGSRDR